jgi:hypothetical protein
MGAVGWERGEMNSGNSGPTSVKDEHSDGLVHGVAFPGFHDGQVKVTKMRQGTALHVASG